MAKGSLREVQALLGRKKLAISKVGYIGVETLTLKNAKLSCMILCDSDCVSLG